MVAVRVGARRDREGVTPGGYRPLFSAQEQSEDPGKPVARRAVGDNAAPR